MRKQILVGMVILGCWNSSVSWANPQNNGEDRKKDSACLRAVASVLKETFQPAEDMRRNGLASSTCVTCGAYVEVTLRKEPLAVQSTLVQTHVFPQLPNFPAVTRTVWALLRQVTR